MIFEATFKGIQERQSKHGGTFYYMFFTNNNGESLKVHAYPKLRNFRNWRGFLTTTRGAKVGGLKKLKGYDNLIDGNSKPVILREVKINQIKLNFEKAKRN